MRSLLIAAAFTLAVPALAHAQEAAHPPKLFAPAAEADAALAKSRAEHKPGNNVTVLVSVGPYPAQLEYRIPGAPPSASVHKAQAEFIYVIAGGCTLTTGGTLVDPKDNGANMSGTGIAGGKKIEGTFIGGTGRFMGATGSFTFTWQFVIDTEDGRIQGQTSDLSGRIRAGQNHE